MSTKRDLMEWRDSFQKSSTSQINAFISKIKGDLYTEMARFAEKHYADKNSDIEWNKVIDNHHLEEQCQSLIQEFEVRCNDKLREISKQIENELRFSASVTSGSVARMHRIFNGRRVWKWSTLLLGSGLTIGSLVSYILGATIAGPLGIGAAGIAAVGGLGDLFFKSRDRKAHEARIQLENSLKKNIERICNSLEIQLVRSLDVLLAKRIDQFIVELEKIDRVVFRLADTQRSLSWELNSRLLELNKDSLLEALKLLNMEELSDQVLLCARIPGSYCYLLINEGTIFPNEFRNNLRKLISERVGFVVNHSEKKVIVSRVLGKSIDRRNLSVEEKLGVIHMNGNIDMNPELEQRILIAQQLSGMQIIS